jgi:hypothetical protein
MTALTWSLIIIAIIAIGFAAIVVFRTRTRKLKSQFGPEYDRVVHERGSTLKAERELENRQKRVDKLQIRYLSKEESSEFAREWRASQEKFVDDPRGAVADADHLVHRTMKARGYPIGGEFEDRAADLSVEHSFVVEHYRAAHDVAARDSRNPVTTEDLRLAMQHYRFLFEDLLGSHVEEVTGVKR